MHELIASLSAPDARLVGQEDYDILYISAPDWSQGRSNFYTKCKELATETSSEDKAALRHALVYEKNHFFVPGTPMEELQGTPKSLLNRFETSQKSDFPCKMHSVTLFNAYWTP